MWGGSSLPVNNLSARALYTVHSTVGNTMFHFSRSIKWPRSSCGEFCKKIKWINDRWCVGHSFLPLLPRAEGRGGNRKSVSEEAKESRVQVNCGCPSISTSQYLLEHAQRHGGGRARVEGWPDAAGRAGTLSGAWRRVGVL